MTNPHNLYYRLVSEDEETRTRALQQYQDWIKHPVTQEMLEHLRRMQDVLIELPLPPDALNGNGISSAQRMWQLHGLRLALSRLERMDEEAMANLQRKAQAGADMNRLHDDFFTTPVAT